MATNKPLPVTVVNREDGTLNEEATARINRANKNTGPTGRPARRGGTPKTPSNYYLPTKPKEKKIKSSVILLTYPPKKRIYYEDGTTEVVPMDGQKASWSPEEIEKFKKMFKERRIPKKEKAGKKKKVEKKEKKIERKKKAKKIERKRGKESAVDGTYGMMGGGKVKKYGYMGGGKVYGQPRKANYKAG